MAFTMRSRSWPSSHLRVRPSPCAAWARGSFTPLSVLIFINMRRENPLNFAHRIEPSLVWRVMVFGFYAVLALGLAIWSAVDWDAKAADLIFATFAFGMWCAFGTQKVGNLLGPEMRKLKV